MQLYYCEKCGLRIQQDDLDAGRARMQEGSNAICPTCAAHSVPVPEAAASPGASPILTATGSARVSAHSKRVHRDPSDKQAPAKTPLLLGVAGGVVLLAILFVAFRSKPEPAADGASGFSQPSARVSETQTSKPVLPAGTPTVEQPKASSTVPEPVVATLKTETVVDFREGYAARRWADLKTSLEKPGSEWSSALSIQDFLRTYGSTAPGREAAEWFKKVMGSALPTPMNTVAGYRRDFAQPNPKQGWSYQWNGNGALGQAANYRPLVWNADIKQYCGHATTFPCARPVGYTYAAPERIHPGTGTEQGEPFDRYVIAAYTLQPGQEGRMALSVRLKRLNGSHGSVEIQVLVNDASKGRVTGTGDEMNGPLGVLKAGDTIHVAIGPNRNDGADGSELDFSIYKID